VDLMSGPDTGPVAAIASAETSPPAPTLRIGRVRDTPKLVRLYLSLSPKARHAFHPFPFNRLVLWFIYPMILAYQTVARPLMRRFPRSIVMLLVAERPGTPEPLGYGTIRGLVRPDGRPAVRYGSLVRDGSQGKGVVYAIMTGLGEQALSLGVTVAIASVFRSDDRTVHVCRRFGFEVHLSDWVDPGAPEEATYEVVADLVAILRPTGVSTVPRPESHPPPGTTSVASTEAAPPP
jgi:hypothetical protein